MKSLSSRQYFPKFMRLLRADNSHANSLKSGFIHIREMSGRFNFFQAMVREFCDVLGKNEILQKCRGMSRNFTFQHDQVRMFGPDVFFLLKS